MAPSRDEGEREGEVEEGEGEEGACPEGWPAEWPSLRQSLAASPRLSRTDLQYLRQWLAKQPHLPMLTETELVPFLHSNGYSLERTKACLDKYFTLRTHAPEFFQRFHVDREDCRNQLDIHRFAVLPKRDARGRRVVCSALATRDAACFDYDALNAALYALLDVVAREDPVPPAGVLFLVDSAHATFAHLAKASVASVAKSALYFQEALPLRMEEIHVVNANAVTEAAFALARPFLGDELQRLLHFHSGKMDKLYEVLPRDILPVEFGGTLGSLTEYHAEAVERLRARGPWLQALGRMRVDEAKRPAGGPRSCADVYGIQGSFKKLDID